MKEHKMYAPNIVAALVELLTELHPSDISQNFMSRVYMYLSNQKLYYINRARYGSTITEDWWKYGR